MTTPVLKVGAWKRNAGLAAFVALAGLPLLLGISYALIYSLGLAGLLSEGFTLVHWREVFSSEAFWLSLGFSFYLALISIGI
ncbi:MAG: hypothetical protein R3350_06795, partial [Saprospiraceae bacterium]|nr:hypothetical protein [Saprospiraceae bacterium]